MQSSILTCHEEQDFQSNKRSLKIGRRIGILLLLQLIAGLTLPFILSKAITVGSPAFLTAVAAQSIQIKAAVFISFVGTALTLGLGITSFEVLRDYSRSGALLFIIVCGMSCVMDLIHAGSILSMLSISNQYVSSGGGNSDLYKIVGAALSSARRSAHIIQLVAIGAWMFVFYFSLFRFRLIPRVIAVAGIIGVLLQFSGVTLMMLLGYPIIGEMAMPLLPIEIIVGTWLGIKGLIHAPSESLVSRTLRL